MSNHLYVPVDTRPVGGGPVFAWFSDIYWPLDPIERIHAAVTGELPHNLAYASQVMGDLIRERYRRF